MSEPTTTTEMARARSSESPETDSTPQEPATRTFTDQEREELTHFVVYGQPNSEPPTRRTLRSDWNTEEFITPVTSPWDISLTQVQIKRLELGFDPQQMEDKWFVFAEEENEEIGVHFFRSWTGNKIFEVVVELQGEAKGGKIKELIWESSQEVVGDEGEEGAKEMVIEVCRWVLNVELRSQKQIEEQERRDEEELES
ncbi:uncharacterized protein PAC_13821 [Phialocephala subalpina]|uniref:Uncharacterized protein n=1 Tax=Phialocephala subalpina TaxID=576137 RepID=A0A1L7XFX6_9HELO|nr:uncharacterized protein PAC_13821 [Phialocephala subalpina]